MNYVIRIFIVLAIGALSCFGNSDVRDWKLTNGDKLRAELVDYFPKEKEVLLLIANDDERRLSYEEFSEVDKAWLLAWDNMSENLKELREKFGGRLESTVVAGDFETDLFCYFPSSYDEGQRNEFPLMILFHAGGKAERYLSLHMEAAEATNMVVIACGQFRNKASREEASGFRDRFSEVFTFVKESIEFSPNKVFMGGISGGALRAFNYSWQESYSWAGIYSNGGWLGGKGRSNTDYPDGMRIVMVNGNQDKAANHWVEHDSEILNKHNSEIALIAFEGGHQIPPPATQIVAFQWLLETEEYVED